MSATQAINPNQLRMFMTAPEIQAEFGPLEGDRVKIPGYEAPAAVPRRWETDDEVWDRKYNEAVNVGRYGELADSVLGRREGVRDPVHLGHHQDRSPFYGRVPGPAKQVVGGHHRVALMAKELPEDLIPVVHQEMFQTARSKPSVKAYPYT